MARLRLAASDAEDLEVLSARLQDAVFKLKDASWQPGKRRFAEGARESRSLRQWQLVLDHHQHVDIASSGVEASQREGSVNVDADEALGHHVGDRTGE